MSSPSATSATSGSPVGIIKCRSERDDGSPVVRRPSLKKVAFNPRVEEACTFVNRPVRVELTSLVAARERQRACEAEAISPSPRQDARPSPRRITTVSSTYTFSQMIDRVFLSLNNICTCHRDPEAKDQNS